MKKTRFTAATIMAALICMAVAQSANAQVVPYKASGINANYYPATGIYEMFGKGHGTHLGKHTAVGKVAPDGIFFPRPGVFFEGTFEGSQIVTAANGDTIEMDLHGDVVLVFNDEGMATGLWYPNFVITGGTGRFKNASGSMSGVAINPPFDPASGVWAFDWFIDGEMDLGKKKKNKK